MKRFFTLAALVAGFAIGGPSLAQTPAQPSTAAANPPAPSAAAAVSRFTLPNGLTVIVKPDRRAPTAVHMLWLRVGAMDEVDGTSGVAHVLEHMMFKGTPDVKPGEFSRRVAAMGGRENAFTSRDYTGYFQQIPANRLEDVMKLEADRFARNQWADEEFVKELEVVKEERRLRTEDNPRALLYENLNASAFHASPYRRPVVGWMSDLDAMTPGDARAFWQRWYVPANAAVVVAGDVDPQEVLDVVARLEGKGVPVVQAEKAAVSGVRNPGQQPEMVKHIDSKKAETLLKAKDSPYVLVDVRTFSEYEPDHSPLAKHLPVDELPHRYQELNQTTHIIFVCQAGGRSQAAAEFMTSIGGAEIYSVINGMAEWQGDRVVGGKA